MSNGEPKQNTEQVPEQTTQRTRDQKNRMAWSCCVGGKVLPILTPCHVTQPGTLTGTQSSHPLISWAAERVSFLPISDIPPEAVPEESQGSNYWNGFTAMTFLQLALGE